MSNMDGTSHIATQRHETIVVQKIKQLGATTSCVCEQNMTGVFANNSSGFYIASVRNYPRKITKKNPTFRGPSSRITTLYCQKKAWLYTEMFCKWLRHLQSVIKKSVKIEFATGLRWPELQLKSYLDMELLCCRR